MEWSDEQVMRCEKAMLSTPATEGTVHWRDQLKSVMTCAVEIVSETVIPEEEFRTAWKSDNYGRVRDFVAAVGARVVMLQSREGAWRHRVEKAAGALAEVATGELGRLDLVGRIERLKADRDEWQRKALERDLEIARLKPSEQVAEDVAFLEECVGVSADHWSAPRTTRARDVVPRLAAGAQEAEALRARVERLEINERGLQNALQIEREHHAAALAEVERLKAKLEDTERARNKAMIDRTNAESRLVAILETPRDMDDEDDADAPVSVDFKTGWHNAVRTMRASIGNVPQEAKPARRTIIHHSMPVCGRCDRAPCTCHAGPTWPCSPTCTHNDAATPGHPERVRQSSETVKAELNQAAQRSEDWRLGFEDGQKSSSPACDHEDSTVYHRGLEDMRSACLEAVANYMRSFFGGMPPALKAAIEGAAL